MEIAVVSDTHGNLEGLRQAVREILLRREVGLFIHLGDEYDDAQVFDEFACEYLRVPGVYDSRYRDRTIANRLLKEFEGWRFLVTHTDTSHANDLPEDLRPEDLVANKQVDVVLCGHSHKPHAEVKGVVLFLNPGHLKAEDKKGFRPSYAIVKISRNQVKAKIVALGAKRVLEEAVLARSP
ncbi:MAG: metallophosphoesterase family protein [Candidatus Eisenbacteria bacterium]